MYKVDTPTNSLHSLQEVSFSSLGFRERDHLQEWLAKNPQALTRDNDDELLIIQKEFKSVFHFSPRAKQLMSLRHFYYCLKDTYHASRLAKITVKNQ